MQPEDMQPEDWETPDHSNQDAYDELLAAIEASENQLSLLIAVCDDPGLQVEIIQRYETDLAPNFRHYRLTLVRGEPSLKAAINQAIAEHEDLKQGSKAVLTLTGIEQLHFLRLGEAKSEQDVFFGYLQWTREGLREFQFPIVIWLTYQILAQLSRKSPDFWSWRRGVFRFVSRKTIAISVRELDAFRQELEPMLSGLDEDTLIPIDDLKALIQQTERRNPNDPLLATLYNQMGRIYSRRVNQGKAQDYRTEQTQAIEYYQKAIALQEELGQALDLANSLTGLGFVFQAQGFHTKAEPFLQRSLAIREQKLGPDHRAVATILSELGIVYCRQGQYDQAELLLQRAMAIQEQQLGCDHPDVASTLGRLGELHRYQEHYDQAESFYQKSLTIWKQQFGQNHTAVTGTLNNLGLLHYAQGHYAEAEAFYQQSLAVREYLLGHDHPAIAQSLRNLADLCLAQENYVDAESLFRRALVILEQQRGENHPHTTYVREQLQQLQLTLQKTDRPTPRNFWQRWLDRLRRPKK